MPYRFNTGCTTLVISLILASFIVVLLKRSLAHVAYQGMDKEISTRKVFMSGLGWISEQLRFVLQVIMRSDEQKGFHVLPRQWVVEKTFAWLNHNRRLCKDYEVLPETSEAIIHLAMIHFMLRRLAS